MFSTILVNKDDHYCSVRVYMSSSSYAFDIHMFNLGLIIGFDQYACDFYVRYVGLLSADK